MCSTICNVQRDYTNEANQLALIMHSPRASDRFDFIWSCFLADPLVPDAASGVESILQECPLSLTAYTHQVPQPSQIFIRLLGFTESLILRGACFISVNYRESASSSLVVLRVTRL